MEKTGQMAGTNKGTAEGTAEEEDLVRFLNRNKNCNPIWDILLSSLGIVRNINCYYAVRVTTKQISKLTGKKVFPKADVYIARSSTPILLSFLKKREFFLDENDVRHLGLEKVDYSGISVKRRDSARYQILKMHPDAFYKLFKSYELGAGASLYCMSEEGLAGNNSVVKGWHTTWKNMVRYFREHVPGIMLLGDPGTVPAKKTRIIRQIKNYSTAFIKETIKNNPKLLDFIFKGEGNFEEPYTATWLYEKGKFRKNEPFSFTVTTGSGRSRGDFTIVIKP